MDTSAVPSAEVSNPISPASALAFSPRLEIVIGPLKVALACAIKGGASAVGVGDGASVGTAVAGCEGALCAVGVLAADGSCLVSRM